MSALFEDREIESRRSPKHDSGATKSAPIAFDWNGQLPSLEPHSEAKLKILRNYLVEYIRICCGALPRGAPDFSLYLIDGFCGGGEYDEGKLGSPLVLLKAIEEAEFIVNKGRGTPIKINAKYWFVDESRGAIDHLKNKLISAGYAEQLGESIMLQEKRFEEAYSEICTTLKKTHSRGGARAIFFLDQCGYSKVPPAMLKDISKILPKAEFIVNFSIGWLSDFLSDHDGAQKLLESTGVGAELTMDDLIRSRKYESESSWAWTVESKISTAYQRLSGAAYFSPFFIMPQRNHRGYWLLHLAPHPRARQAMVGVHWQTANGTRHFGKTGLEILTYKPEINAENYLSGISFDSLEKNHLLSALARELPDVIFATYPNGTSYSNLMAELCNQTNADVSSIQEILACLYQDQQISISGPNGGPKRIGNRSMASKDLIVPKRQKWFDFNL